MPTAEARRRERKEELMRNSLKTLSLATSVVAALSGPALAQPRDYQTVREVPVKTDAIEISVAGVYLQNAEDSGTVMNSAVADTGFGGDISVGVRLTPNLAIAAYASAAGFPRGSALKEAGSGAIGVKIDWHIDPRAPAAPWISLGAGVKELWIGGRDVLDADFVGIELAKFQAGVDYRLTPSFSLGPTVSASATMFTHERTSVMSDFAELDDKAISYSVSAGILGRFDLFGTTR